MTDKQPEALIRADELEQIGAESSLARAMAAHTIRLLYKENEALRARFTQPEPDDGYCQACDGNHCTAKNGCVALDNPRAQPEPEHREVVIAGDLWRVEFLPNNDANVRLVKANYTSKHEEVEQAMLGVWQDVGDPRFPHIAQPEPEPVAWWHDMGDVVDLNVSGRGTPLYTAPQQREWQGLTDEEILEEYRQSYGDDGNLTDVYFARAIEAKLKEKNT